MSNPYKTREGGATVTVFVPYDCQNNCPFCVNKEEYENMEGFSLEKICESIRVMDGLRRNAILYSPAANRFRILNLFRSSWIRCRRRIRSISIRHLPVFADRTGDEMIEFVERNKDKITCINISRHLVPYVEESPDELIARIPTNTRVNCVLYRDYPRDELVQYMRRFKKYRIPIQFRFDYTDTTPENLYDEEHDMILRDLKEFCRYTGLDGCRMRCGYHFNFEGLELTYHKTLPYSTIVENDGDQTYDILYDILIKQNGDIHGDWDGKILDVEKYRNVTFEPYDLRWIETC